MGTCMSSGALEYYEILAFVPFFAGLSEKNLKVLARQFHVESYEVGWKVFNEGDVADKFYVVVDGELSITNKDDKGEAHFLANISATKEEKDTKSCKYFGETALMKSDVFRTATVTAIKKTQLVCLSKKNYFKLKQPWIVPVREQIEQVARSRLSDIVAKVPFLSKIPPNRLNTLGELFSFRVVPPGEVIFREGEEGDTFYVVIAGEVSISVHGETGENIVICTRGPGTSFGEVALLDPVKRTATITAVMEAKLLCLGAPEFKKFLKIVPEVKASLELMVRQRTVQNLKHLQVPTFKHMTDKQLAKLAAVCKTLPFATGDVIFSEGDPSDNFYILVQGLVNIYVKDEKEEDKLVKELAPGCYFGEIGLVSNTARTGSAFGQEGGFCLSFDQSSFLKIFQSTPDLLADIAIRIMGVETDLIHVIYHNQAVKYFEAQLEKEFSMENIDFWREADKYYRVPKSIDEKSIFSKLGQELYEKYIPESAPKQVNLKSNNRQPIEEALKSRNWCRDTFKKAQDEIFLLMEKDNFARFKKTAGFKDMLHELEVYNLSDTKRFSKAAAQATDIKTIKLTIQDSIDEDDEYKARERGKSVEGTMGAKSIMKSAKSADV